MFTKNNVLNFTNGDSYLQILVQECAKLTNGHKQTCFPYVEDTWSNPIIKLFI